MKVCQECGHINFEPKDQCPQCKAKYKNMPATCTPDLGGKVSTGGTTEAPGGKAWRKSPDHTGGY